MMTKLETQELHLTERKYEMGVEQQALKAAFSKKYQKQPWSEAKKRFDGVQKSKTSTSERQKSSQKGKEKYDSRKVQCYYCKKFDHFTADCWSNKERQSKEANIAKGDFDDYHKSETSNSDEKKHQKGNVKFDKKTV